jgi:hypothetical protein
MKVFLTKTLCFTRFCARALTVFLGKKKFAEARHAKTLEFFSPKEKTKLQPYESAGPLVL